MWTSEAPLTRRDYLMIAGALLGAFVALVGMVYLISRLVNYWWPVGCAG